MGESPEAGHSALIQFGARVRARRKALSLSQEALAERCGLHWTYLGQVERGRRNVSLLNILRIAAALQAGAGELIDDLPPSDTAR